MFKLQLQNKFSCVQITQKLFWKEIKGLHPMQQWFHTLFESFIVSPVRKMFLHGPASLGCWAGQTVEDICSQLTQTPSYFWATHEEECQNLIEQRFTTFLVSTQTLLYFITLYKCLGAVCEIATVTIFRPKYVLARLESPKTNINDK